MFDLYHERAHWLWLVACSAFVGLAYLTRYSALALAITFGVGLLVLHKSWRKRLISLGIFTLGLLPWISGWAIRNSAVGGTITNRTLVWHPITDANIDTALRTVSGFLVPVEAWQQAFFEPQFLSILVGDPRCICATSSFGSGAGGFTAGSGGSAIPAECHLHLRLPCVDLCLHDPL
jgi:4-amino-4-deoxy-L-arabinose transferase-like glycosyltransferase